MLGSALPCPRHGCLPICLLLGLKLLLAAVKVPLPFSAFLAVLRADHGDLPAYLVYGEEIAAELLRISGHAAPPELVGKEIADWLLAQRVRRLQALLQQKK